MIPALLTLLLATHLVIARYLRAIAIALGEPNKRALVPHEPLVPYGPGLLPSPLTSQRESVVGFGPLMIAAGAVVTMTQTVKGNFKIARLVLPTPFAPHFTIESVHGVPMHIEGTKITEMAGAQRLSLPIVPKDGTFEIVVKNTSATTQPFTLAVIGTLEGESFPQLHRVVDGGPITPQKAG